MTNNVFFEDLRKTDRFDIVCGSDIGERESQQDAGYIAACDTEVLAVLCDGMGGLSGGSLASRLAIETFLDCYEMSGGASSQKWMPTAVSMADSAVFSMQGQSGERLGAGTTLVAANIKDGCLSWISVGDSRLYLARDGELIQVTNDHNYYFELNQQLQAGVIDRNEYWAKAVDGEALISYIGMGGLTLKDICDEPFPLAAGDTIMLCTDGVYRTIPYERLQEIITEQVDMKRCADCIEADIRAAASFEQDNYSFALIRIKE